jgi:phosphate transport system substrate-binding protein
LRKIALAAAMVAVLAAACSSSSSTASPTTSATAASQTVDTGNPSSPVTLNESGSTLLYPYLQVLAPPFHQAYPNITLVPGPGGSGKGISDAIAGTVQLGGSDAYLSPGVRAANPGLLNVPIVISAQAINYNLPGISNLKLTGNVLAQIYLGKLTRWNDPAIASLNPGVSLPSVPIVPVRRVDSSGDTFIFTSLLSATNPTWASGPNFGTTVTWPPVSNELTANGNPGMVQTCKATPGCVAYVGVSVEAQARQAGLGEALLQNKAGNFVQPTAATVSAAVAAGAGRVPPDLATSLIYQPGANSYPIVNFEYLVVKSTQPSADVARAIRTFLAWAIDPAKGATPAHLASVNFVALPPAVIPKVKAAIAKITG